MADSEVAGEKKEIVRESLAHSGGKKLPVPYAHRRESQDSRKRTRIIILGLALGTCIISLAAISIVIFHYEALGLWKQSPTLIITSTVLGSAVSVLIGIIAGTSID